MLNACSRRGALLAGLMFVLGPILSKPACAGLVNSESPAAAPIRLLVVISVDQMRADYLDRFGKELKGGFARLRRSGAAFTKAFQAHEATATCPGHATILTGTEPDRNGIVGNWWLDRAQGRVVYCVDDPAFGKSPQNLLVPTLGDALKARDAKSKVVAIAGKDRAAILMGGKRADAAVWYDAKSGAFATSPYYGELPGWAQGAPEELQGKTTAYFSQVTKTPALDRMTGALVRKAMGALELGGGEPVDLLALSFSGTDYIGHAFGPDSREIRRQILSLDAVLGDLFAELDRRPGPGRFAVILTADHGICADPGSPQGRAAGRKRLVKDVLMAEAEGALEKQFGVLSGGKWIENILYENFYLNHALAARAGIPEYRFLAESAQALGALPEVAEVFRPADLACGRPSTSAYFTLFRRNLYAPRSGDLLVRYKPDYMFTADPLEAAEHGSPYECDSHVPLIFLGPGISQGEFAAPAAVAQLAPTAARLLGLSYPVGEVLKEVFGETRGAAPRFPPDDCP